MNLAEDRIALGFGLLVLAVLGGIGLYLAVQALRGHLRRRTAELELIARFGQALMVDFHLEDLFALLHHQIERLLTVDVFAIDLYRPSTDMAEIVYARFRDQAIYWKQSQTPNGIGTYLARYRHPLLLRGDVNAQIRQLGIEPLQPPSPVCFLGMPLIVANRVVGVLSIESTTDIDAYGPSEVKLMETLAPQIAIALYNADLYARLSAITGELTRINDLAHTVNATLNLDEALNRVCHDLLDLLNADRSAVFLCSEDRQTISVVASAGLSADYVALLHEVSISEPEALLSSVVRVQKPFVIANVHTDPRALGWRSIAEAEGFVGVTTVPVRHNDQTIGLICVYCNRLNNPSPEQVMLLQTLSNQIGAAVVNARLFQEANQRAEDMLHVVETSATISQSLDPQAVAQALADRATQILSFDVAAVFSTTPIETNLELLAVQGNRTIPDEMSGARTLVEAAALRQPIALPSDTDDMALLASLNLSSALALPLISRSTVMGVLFLGSERERRLTVRERQLVGTLLNQAATALENARLFHLINVELDERIRQLTALESLSRKMTRLTDVPSVIQAVLNAAHELVGAGYAACGLEEIPGELRFMVFEKGTLPTVDRQKISIGIVGRVVRTGVPTLCGDVSRDTDYHCFVSDTRSELCVPILNGGKPIGVLNLESSRLNAFTLEHLAFMTALADHAALAIEQARLFTRIRTGNEQMRLILDSAQDGMALIGADGRLIRANAAIAHLIGHPLEDHIGRNFLRLLHAAIRSPDNIVDPGYVRQQLKDWLHSIKSGIAYDQGGTYQILSGGVVRDVLAIALPVRGEQQETEGWLLVLRNVSEEKANERFRERLIDMIVHDLRSPLGSTITSLNVLRTMLSDDSGKDVERLMDIATQNAGTLLERIESILEIKGIGNGQINLDQRPTCLYVLTRNAIQMLQAAANDAEVRIVNQVSDTFPPLRIDADQITRVVVNLLDNALKYTPSGGEIRIEAEHQAGSRLATVRVIDTGPGIPAQYRRQVFDLFVTFPGNIKRGRRGMGLGLTFCRMVVDAHGGSIWADTGNNGGAVIGFTLPVEESYVLQTTPHQNPVLHPTESCT